MSSTKLRFHFDFLSPYAYFAWLRVEAFCADHGLELEICPTLLTGLLNHWGHLGPAEIPPKREFVFKDALRYAALHDIEMQFPKYHPFNPLVALRVSLAMVSGEAQSTVVHALFRASWGEHRDIGNPQVVAEVLNGVGLEGHRLVEMTREAEVKDELRAITQRAVNHGVFGVPTMVVDQELFWGNDQFENMARFLDGQDPVDAPMLDRLAQAVGTAQRKRP